MAFSKQIGLERETFHTVEEIYCKHLSDIILLIYPAATNRYYIGCTHGYST